MPHNPSLARHEHDANEMDERCIVGDDDDDGDGEWQKKEMEKTKKK